jgi:hypothetical protein
MALDLKIEDTFTFKEGKKEGKMEKQDKMILAFLKKGKFSHEDIAEAAEVSLDYVKKIAEELINNAFKNLNKGCFIEAAFYLKPNAFK